jgi:hypothetical protein
MSQVVSGWSHVVLRGLTADMDSRRQVFCAWGRRDMAQYPALSAASGDQAEGADGGGCVTADGQKGHQGIVPHRLAPLPEGRELVEVWCGSEFTLAADDEGGLWGCGWNEHGNLGVGNTLTPGEVRAAASAWQRVVRSADRSGDSGAQGLEAAPVRLEHVWEGAVACGGGHALCLPEW